MTFNRSLNFELIVCWMLAFLIIEFLLFVFKNYCLIVLQLVNILTSTSRTSAIQVLKLEFEEVTCITVLLPPFLLDLASLKSSMDLRFLSLEMCSNPSSWSEFVWLLHSSRRWCWFSCGCRCKLFPWGFAAGGISCWFFGTCHFEQRENGEKENNLLLNEIGKKI